MRRRLAALALGLTAATAATAATAVSGDARYLKDFEFIADTVAQRGAAVKSKSIDWKAACARLKPKFEACASDAAHVANVMELLATLRDSHTDVTWTSIDSKDLPQFAGGMFGGGIWVGWDEGIFYAQGMLADHGAQSTLPLGSAIAAIGAEPTWLALERERRRTARYFGISSDHWLYSASLSYRSFPFGEAQAVDLSVVAPDGDLKKVSLPRWGPGGKGFTPSVETLPEGVEWKDGAVASFLKAPWCKKLGYLRITGGMNAETAEAFHAAFDSLKGIDALVLDGRGMGGGGDGEAWEMCGRLFPKGVANGRNGRIEPTGSWQFAGPVVFLQDERMVSSAETFAWAVTETERVVSVGRRTGGWGIIPNGFECPSGLAKFRLGVSDRPTPIQGIHTEGKGWPADVELPYGTVICARKDPALEFGLAALEALVKGASRDAVIAMFKKPAEAKWPKGFDSKPWVKILKDDLEATLKLERELLDDEKLPPSAIFLAPKRLEKLKQRAAGLGLSKSITPLEAKVKSLAAEAAAQSEFLALADDDVKLDAAARAAFVKKHAKTRFARWITERAERD